MTACGIVNIVSVEPITIFGVPISLMDFDDAVASMAELIRKNGSKFVVLSNVKTLNHAYESQRYRQILKNADLVLRDGAGVKWAARKKGADPRHNFVGTDFIPRFCDATSSEKYRVYLLGAQPGIAESASEKMQSLVPGIQIAGYHHGYFENSEEPRIIDDINKSNSDILLVAFGNPKQEMWIAKNISKLEVSLSIGVGALFDYLSERVPRAPQWMLYAEIEWLYRLAIEPGRLWKRYLLGNPLFVYRVYREIYTTRFKRGKEESVD